MNNDRLLAPKRQQQQANQSSDLIIAYFFLFLSQRKQSYRTQTARMENFSVASKRILTKYSEILRAQHKHARQFS